jgi:hypothetical protein
LEMVCKARFWRWKGPGMDNLCPKFLGFGFGVGWHMRSCRRLWKCFHLLTSVVICKEILSRMLERTLEQARTVNEMID